MLKSALKKELLIN